MNDNYYTLELIGGTEKEYGHIPIPKSFETLNDCVEWAEEKRINYYLLQVTEFDNTRLNEQGKARINYSTLLDTAMDKFLYSNKGFNL